MNRPVGPVWARNARPAWAARPRAVVGVGAGGDRGEESRRVRPRRVLPQSLGGDAAPPPPADRAARPQPSVPVTRGTLSTAITRTSDDKDAEDPNSARCVICLDALSMDTDRACNEAWPGCRHLFHEACLTRYRATQDPRNKLCPTCSSPWPVAPAGPSQPDNSHALVAQFPDRWSVVYDTYGEPGGRGLTEELPTGLRSLADFNGWKRVVALAAAGSTRRAYQDVFQQLDRWRQTGAAPNFNWDAWNVAHMFWNHPDLVVEQVVYIRFPFNDDDSSEPRPRRMTDLRRAAQLRMPPSWAPLRQSTSSSTPEDGWAPLRESTSSSTPEDGWALVRTSVQIFARVAGRQSTRTHTPIVGPMKCGICDETQDLANQLEQCTMCSHYMCEDCTRICAVCGETACEDCLQTCESCTQEVCENCGRGCENCDEVTCDECIDGQGLCASCSN